MKEKGWTITFIPWEDLEGKERVLKRFKTTKEKDDFLANCNRTGLTYEELNTLRIINDFNYILSR